MSAWASHVRRHQQEARLRCRATGNQGGSVARRFLRAGFRVRAVTRDTSSAAAGKLADLGAEVVRADLSDVASLTAAFAGANVVFSVTNY